MDTSILDRAICFAVNAHKGAERRGKGFPYIVHPLEAVAIVATMTAKQELLAAAALHDVIEDTDFSAEDIEKEFGKVVADIVKGETDKQVKSSSLGDSWRERKQFAIDRLKNASLEVKMVALGDKLSNIRAIYRDYNAIGDELWQRFHVTDKSEHEWHYRGLASSLTELIDTEAYKEFVSLIDKVFDKESKVFSLKRADNDIIFVSGEIGRVEAEEIIKEVGNIDCTLDFSAVSAVNFAAQRYFLNSRDAGYKFCITNASQKVAAMFDTTGASKFISISKKPVKSDLSTYTRSGEGFNAKSYFSSDNDSMMKLYEAYIPQETIFKEKRCAEAALIAGIPTPLSGELIKIGDQIGIVFERIMQKKSIARTIADDPDSIDFCAKLFAEMGLKLHATKCDKAVFPSIDMFYRNLVKQTDKYTDTEKAKIIAFLDSVEDTDTCLHGDFHMGNVIISDGKGIFIDMSDFSYGNKNNDISTFYYVANCLSEELAQKLYHVDKATLNKFWIAFVKYYYGVSTQTEIDKIEAEIKPFAALKAFMFSNFLDKDGHNRRFVEDILLK